MATVRDCLLRASASTFVVVGSLALSGSTAWATAPPPPPFTDLEIVNTTDRDIGVVVNLYPTKEDAPTLLDERDTVALWIGRVKRNSSLHFNIGRGIYDTWRDGLTGVAKISVLASYYDPGTGSTYATRNTGTDICHIESVRRPPGSWTYQDPNHGAPNPPYHLVGRSGYANFEPSSENPTLTFYRPEGSQMLAVDLHARWRWGGQEYAPQTNGSSDDVTRSTRWFEPVGAKPTDCPCPDHP